MTLKKRVHSTERSPYMHVVNPNISYVKMDNSIGKGTVHTYNTFDGISILKINISSKTWPISTSLGRKNFIFLNYCIKGRCEVSLANGLTTCVSEGEICISKSYAIKEFFYPLGKYEGIKLIFDIDTLKQTSEFFINSFDMDILETLEQYTTTNLTFVASANEKLKQLINELQETTTNNNLFEMRLNILRLLYLISNPKIILANKKQVYLSPSQVQLANAVEEIITKDLQKKITIASLSQKFGVSETTLKTYFKGLYGTNISTYLQEIRMNEAARQLSQTKNQISDIAGSVGYDNQSKFAAVFKKFLKISPSEYRRLKQFENNK